MRKEWRSLREKEKRLTEFDIPDLVPAPRDPHYGRGRDEEDCCKASERSGGIIQSTVYVCQSCIYDCIYLKLYLPSLNKTYFEVIILICQLIHVLIFFVFPYSYLIKLYFHYIAYKPRHEPINHIFSFVATRNSTISDYNYSNAIWLLFQPGIYILAISPKLFVQIEKHGRI